MRIQRSCRCHATPSGTVLHCRAYAYSHLSADSAARAHRSGRRLECATTLSVGNRAFQGALPRSRFLAGYTRLTDRLDHTGRASITSQRPALLHGCPPDQLLSVLASPRAAVVDVLTCTIPLSFIDRLLVVLCFRRSVFNTLIDIWAIEWVPARRPRSAICNIARTPALKDL